MARFANNYGIKHIQMQGIHCPVFCPIGQSICTYQFEIDMGVGGTIPDYIEVGKWFEDQIWHEHLTIEAAACKVRNYIVQEYNPTDVVVKVTCTDARHMPVVVTSEWNSITAAGQRWFVPGASSKQKENVK